MLYNTGFTILDIVNAYNMIYKIAIMPQIHVT